MKIRWALLVLVGTASLVAAQVDKVYIEKFKGNGRLASEGGFSIPADSSIPTQDFLGAVKRVVYADKAKGVDLQFFSWSKILGTWSSGFYFGANLSSQSSEVKAKSISEIVTLRHFPSKELNVAESGNSPDSSINFQMATKDQSLFSLTQENFSGISFEMSGTDSKVGGPGVINFSAAEFQPISSPSFVLWYILIAYVWQSVWYYFLGKKIKSWSEVPLSSLPMAVFLYMEAFNMYSQNSFENKPLLRFLVPFGMGLNYLIILAPNRAKIFAKHQEEIKTVSEYKNMSCPVHTMIVEKMASQSDKEKRLCKRWKIYRICVLVYGAVCFSLLTVFQFALPQAMAMSVVPCLNYGLAAETMFMTRRPSNAIFGMIAYYPFIALIYIFRIMKDSPYGLPMRDDPYGFFFVAGFTTFKILLSSYCTHRKNKKRAENVPKPVHA